MSEFHPEVLLAKFNGPVDFRNIHSCQAELQLCATALTYFDHIWGQLLDALDEAEAVWEDVEAKAARTARTDAPKAATATEIKAGITEYVNRTPSARKALDTLREKRRQKARLERKMRTAEKRIGAAQSAQNGHDKIARGGG